MTAPPSSSSSSCGDNHVRREKERVAPFPPFMIVVIGENLWEGEGEEGGPLLLPAQQRCCCKRSERKGGGDRKRGAMGQEGKVGSPPPAPHLLPSQDRERRGENAFPGFSIFSPYTVGSRTVGEERMGGDEANTLSFSSLSHVTWTLTANDCCERKKFSVSSSK